MTFGLVLFGFQALVRFLMSKDDEPQQKNTKKSRINLMLNVLVVEMIANILRTISAWGTGLNMLDDRFIN